jgi:triacylglycerol esterase/lipase EstA (alpha/beta hydrolase family)
VAARFWRAVLGIELALAVAIAALVAAERQWTLSATLLMSALMLALLQFVLVASSFMLARAVSQGGSFGGASGGLSRTLMMEFLHFGAAQVRMSAEPLCHLSDVSLPPAGQPARPVLLIHGIACNRAVWWPVLSHLRGAGFAPIRLLDLEPLFSDIESHGAAVEYELRALQRRCSGVPVSIVAHSMGGLVARTVLRAVGQGLIARIVTIATPHHGTAAAGLFRSANMRQMRRGSAWLEALNAAQEPMRAVPFTCIYSLEDNLVAPARSAALAGAQLHELRGLGHLQLLSSQHVIDHVLTALNTA